MFKLVVPIVPILVMAGSLAWAQPAPQAPDRELVVAAYNIRHGAGNDTCTTPPGQANCALNLPRIAEVIRASGADIVALQEVDRFWIRSGLMDQPQVLADLLGWHACYGANLDHPPDSHSPVAHQYGTATLSRLPILSCENTLLPRTGTGEQRGLLETLINVRGVPLRFYNTHLHTTLADRMVQTEAIAAHIQQRSTPAILAGDLNALPTEPSLQVLYELLVDVWPVARPDDDGFTFPARPTQPPNRRIDYIFVSPDVGISGAKVDVDDLTVMASDHYPVVAEVVLPGTSVGIGRRR
jgi:endonuclease/exonuclease/phosphatase family metal-dependent hydrolase